MSCLAYHENELYLEDKSLIALARQFGTPCYIYSLHQLQKNYQAFSEARPAVKHRICYAVKANSNLSLLKVLTDKGSGFDIVSGGELARVLAAGCDPKKIVFSGVGKTRQEMIEAIVKGVGCFNIESEAELMQLKDVAEDLQKKVAIALRVNPNIDAKTHPHIATGRDDNKFGIPSERIVALCIEIAAMQCFHLKGLAMHIGSQITCLSPFETAIDHLISLYKALAIQGINVQTLDIGGGLGIAYHDEHPPTISHFLQMIEEKLQQLPVEIILEPGRAIIGNAGILLTKVLYLKQGQKKHFAIVDAAMNDYIRPALYNAYQEILPVIKRAGDETLYDIVGPVCESGDYLGKSRSMHILNHDLLAVCDVGAYGFSMSSNYNSRPRPAEILVDGDTVRVIRQRESIEMLYALETF